jgi:hypothetical protein
MVQVRDIFQEAKKIVGVEGDNDEFLFRRMTDAVELLANKGDFDPLLGALDIGVHDRMVSLPPEVETILGMNICGHPALARDQMFRFHLNGLGDRHQSLGLRGWRQFEWEFLNTHPTYRELDAPSKIIAYCSKAEDAGKPFWVEGYDESGNIVRTKVGDVWMNGWPVPVVVSFMSLPTDAPTFSRITRIRKSETFVGASRLSTIDLSTMTGVLLGVYQFNETDPNLRRVRLSHCVPWIRIFFRKATFKITSIDDYIPLGNAQAFLMMLRALRNYDSPGGIAEAEAQEATALRWLSEEQHTSTPPVVHPITVVDGGTALNDKTDYVE